MKKGGMTWLYPQNYCNKENLKQIYFYFTPKIKSFQLMFCAPEEGTECPGAGVPAVVSCLIQMLGTELTSF